MSPARTCNLGFACDVVKIIHEREPDLHHDDGDLGGKINDEWGVEGELKRAQYVVPITLGERYTSDSFARECPALELGGRDDSERVESRRAASKLSTERG